MNRSDQSSILATTIVPSVARSWLIMELTPTDLSWSLGAVSHQATGKHAERVSTPERTPREYLRLHSFPKDICYHLTNLIDFAELHS